MIESIEKELRKFGLSSYEAKAYVALLKYGSMTSTELAKKAGIPQPRVYDVVRRLERKGLVVVAEGHPARYYALDPPTSLRKLVEQKVRELENTYSSILSIFTAYRERNESVADIVRLESILSIDTAVENLIKEARYEFLFAGYCHTLRRYRELIEFIPPEVSKCAILYDECREAEKLFGEVRRKVIRGPTVLIADRRRLVVVPRWWEPEPPAPLGFFTENKFLIQILGEYYLFVLRDYSRVLQVEEPRSGGRRRFVFLPRATDYIDMALDKRYAVRVKVNGTDTRTRKNVVVIGDVERIQAGGLGDGVTRLYVRTPKGIVTVGGWEAYLEDVEAETIEVEVLKKKSRE